MMDNGNNHAAVAFAMHLVRICLVDNRTNPYGNEADLSQTTEMLTRLIKQKSEKVAPPNEAVGMNQDAGAYSEDRSPLGPAAHIHSGIMEVRVSIHFY